MNEDIYILGIESSCDDTSAAVLKNGVLLSNVTASQAVHEAYGGVVPELASRAHQQNVVPVVDQALKRAGVGKEQLTAVAFTRGPGLMGSLLVGVSFAKGFARSLGIPMIDVNHLQGHVMVIYGKAIDEQGKPYYMVKNSWGKSGQYKGIWYMSRDYMMLNTTYLFLNRQQVALPCCTSRLGQVLTK